MKAILTRKPYKQKYDGVVFIPKEFIGELVMVSPIGKEEWSPTIVSNNNYTGAVFIEKKHYDSKVEIWIPTPKMLDYIKNKPSGRFE